MTKAIAMIRRLSATAIRFQPILLSTARAMPLIAFNTCIR